MDTNNIKSLNRLPEGVTVTSEGLISCTRDALNHLGNWCKKNAGALAISVFATTGVNAALAGTPAHTADTQSPSATLQATKGYGQEVILKDGNKMTFAELSKLPDGADKDAIINGLTRADKMRFNSYKLELANQTEKSIDNTIETGLQELKSKKTVAETVQQEVKETNNTIETGLQEIKAIDKELINVYYKYISNIEKGYPADRTMVEKIAKLNDPKDLKNRALKILATLPDNRVAAL